MSNKTFIDTLFVVALINQRDAYHQKATQLADEYEGKLLLTTDVVLLEIGNALARNFKQQAVEVIDDFLWSSEVEIVRLSPPLFENAYSLYRQYQDKEWGLIDCVSFVVMREAGVSEALTFDQHFTQAGFRALMRD
ncbi:MAG: type II toxin-antitoxin system VapC family toxin [Deltaproteobacteria bacterium]|nr:type II toxin-antitoxin system VapC family toxin [Deltaproteobacteria bacterium]